MKYYKRGADQGHLEDILKYGYGLANEYLGTKNLPELMKSYKKASDRGYLNAILNYDHGLGCDYLGKNISLEQ
jgi:TPR repeat protein